MIIHKPEITEEPGKVCVSAYVELNKRIPKVPEKLWFKFPEKYKNFVTDRADGFTVGLLLFSMYIGENIEVRGTVSPRLKDGLEEYQKIFNKWFPKKFKRIDITCQNLKKQTQKGKKFAVCGFSGGVDSFFTLYSLCSKTGLDLDSKISYALFIHGRDISIKDKKNFKIIKQSYESLMDKLNLELLPAETNVREFTKDKIRGFFTFGTEVISTALVLGGLISRFYIASSYDSRSLKPCGSHPMLDYLLSTESLDVIHHGADTKRMEKISIISNNPETYPLLRVCEKKIDGLRNCCRCEKCIRTIVSLKLLDKLHNYNTFPLELKPEMIRNCIIKDESQSYFKEIYDYAKRKGKKNISLNIKYAMIQSKFILIPLINLIEYFWKFSSILKNKSRTYRNFANFVKSNLVNLSK